MHPVESSAGLPFGNWLSDLPGKLRQSSDAALAVGVLVMIALMILPVRPWLLDIFLTLNLAVGAILLMSSVLTPTGTKIFTFPTILILTTLFRLALDVSSTRLILSEGDAGEVIRSFGQFAASGSVVVGLVVFLIITLVQMIVISKGAERTANATAVFVRESIPGKQMAIDGDAAAGRITGPQVLLARKQMAVEVEFYGRMYGAMEFIKGDSIAGLVVAAINIVGGLIMGIVVNKMPLAQAVENYTLLTIGAGLVSQIPALVGSVAGTILVSRVSADESASGLGQTAAGQFLALPQAMKLAGVMIGGVGLVPGMPTFTFLILGAALGITGYKLQQKPITRRKIAEIPEPLSILPAPALELRFKSSVPDQLSARARISAIESLEAYGNASGIPFPSWSFEALDESITGKGPAFEVRRMGETVASGDDWKEVQAEFLLDLKLHPFNYFGVDETLRWLLMVGRTNENLVRMVDVKEPEKVVKFHEFLRFLVRERFPIREMATILEKVITSDNKFTDTKDKRQRLSDEVRLVLKEGAAKFYLDHFWVDGSSRFVVANTESEIHKAIAVNDPQSVKKVESLIAGIFSKQARCETSIIAIDKDFRAALWIITENMFRRGDLHRPVLVLSREEGMAEELARVRDPRSALQSAG
jgi:flagellar biosynthesis component FlhA